MNQKMFEKNEIKNILILNLGGIGDILLSVPALRALRQHFSESNIMLLSVSPTAEIINNLGYINQFVSFDFYPQRYGLADWRGLIKTLLDLRQKKIDLMINMRTIVSWQSAIKIALVFWFVGAKYRVGRNTSSRGFFLNLKIPEMDIGDKHESEYDMDTISLLGINVTEKEFELKIDSKDRKYIDDIFNNYCIGTEDMIVGIHPGGMPSRRWPVEKFAMVINKLKEINNKICFVVTGNKEEILLVGKLQKLVSDKLVIIAGKTNPKQLAAMIERYNLLISNDTGIMHIAAVLQKPQIAIFGPGDLIRYNPAKISSNAVVLRSRIDCLMPCNKYDCDTLQCLKKVTPEEVVNAAKNILKIG